MRITLIGPAYPLRGGIAHHVHQVYRALGARRHEVQLISYRRLYPKLIFPGKTTLDQSRERFDPGSTNILDLLNPRTWLQAVRETRRFAPDLVLIEWWTPLLGPALGTMMRLLKNRGYKTVAEVHNVFPHESTALDLPMVVYGLGAADAFLTFSTRNQELLRSHFPFKQCVLTPLPPPFTFKDQGPRNGETMLFFGMVRNYKGLDVLLEAMPQVLRHCDCKLIVAGEFYEPESKYRRLVERLGIAGSVDIRNRYTPNEELSQLFSTADVLILPYRTATQSGVLEMALSSGLPVISSDAGGLGEALRDEGFGIVFPAGNASALAGAIIRYFKGRLGPGMSARLRERAEGIPHSDIGEVIETLATEAKD